MIYDCDPSMIEKMETMAQDLYHAGILEKIGMREEDNISFYIPDSVPGSSDKYQFSWEIMLLETEDFLIGLGIQYVADLMKECDEHKIKKKFRTLAGLYLSGPLMGSQMQMTTNFMEAVKDMDLPEFRKYGLSMINERDKDLDRLEEKSNELRLSISMERKDGMANISINPLLVYLYGAEPRNTISAIKDIVSENTEKESF